MFKKVIKGENAWWRWLVVLFIAIVASQIIGGIPLMMALLESGEVSPDMTDMQQMLARTDLSKNTLFALMMIPFLVGFFALVGAVKLLHKRSFSDTTTGAIGFRWARFFKGFGLWIGLSVLVLGATYAYAPDGFVLNFQPMEFAVLLVLALIFIPIQTGFEEVLFRGYLLQGFELLTHNKWAAVIITSLMFGGLHYFNPEVGEYGFGLAMSQYVFFGLLFGFMTIMDNGLELAWGAHAANNLFLSLFLTHEASALQTPALFEVEQVFPVFDLLSLVFAGLLFMGICWKWFGWGFNVAPRV